MKSPLTRDETVDRLRRARPAILPSLLLCDFANLADEAEAVRAAGAGALHFDVMDGQFVPNFTYGMPIVESLRPHSDLVFDVHLMIRQPQQYVESFIAAGADVVTIHAEAVDDPRPVLETIHAHGAAAGVAINPATSLASIDACLPLCDLILIMSVDAGFGGQSFNPVALEKLRALAERDDVDALLEVDGGVNSSTIEQCALAGAELFVVGSAIFKHNDYTEAISCLRNLAVSGDPVGREIAR